MKRLLTLFNLAFILFSGITHASDETKVDFPLMNSQISNIDPRPPIPATHEYVCRFVCRLIGYEAKLGDSINHSPDRECPVSFTLKISSNSVSPNLYDIEFDSKDINYVRTNVFYEQTHFFIQGKNSFECRPQKKRKYEWKYRAKKVSR